MYRRLRTAIIIVFIIDCTNAMAITAISTPLSTLYDRLHASSLPSFSDSSPSHSFGTSSGYSSSVDYYNTPVLTSKANVSNSNTPNTNSNTNNNNTAGTTSKNNHSPYDGTSAASTSSPPHTTGYSATAIKQETMMPPGFPIDPHNSYSGKKPLTSILLMESWFFNRKCQWNNIVNKW